PDRAERPDGVDVLAGHDPQLHLGVSSPAMDPTEDATMSDTPVGVEDDTDADDQPGEQISLVKTGLVRAWSGHPAKRYRLRRPFFGELKQLRLALEAVQDEIAEKQVKLMELAEQIETEAAELDSDETLTARQRDARLRRLRQRDRKASREHIDAVDDLHVGWWRQVFEMLSVDGVPDDMPAWATDGTFAQRIMQHWRQAPLAPG